MDDAVTVEVLLFARAAELAGCRCATVSVPTGCSVPQLIALLIDQCPDLARLAQISRWAVANEFVDATFEIRSALQIAMIPPVSGG